MGDDREHRSGCNLVPAFTLKSFLNSQICYRHRIKNASTIIKFTLGLKIRVLNANMGSVTLCSTLKHWFLASSYNRPLALLQRAWIERYFYKF